VVGHPEVGPNAVLGTRPGTDSCCEIPFASGARLWRDGLLSPGIPLASLTGEFPRSGFLVPVLLSGLNLRLADYTSDCSLE
jgi:hypothetical protein